MKFLANRFARFDSAIMKFANKANPTLLTIGAIFLPVFLAFVLPSLIFGKSFLSFVPNSSDEIIYWREIKTFTEYGFRGGQYSTNEQPALLSQSPFGSHGPAFTILYGLWGKIFGWQPNSAVLIHLAFVPLVILLAIRIVHPNQKQLLLLTLLLTTWWPLQLYMVSNMQEILHLIIAILLAAFFFNIFTADKSELQSALLLGTILLFGLPFRFIWAFLFFPLILFFRKKRTWRTWLLAASIMAFFLLLGAFFVRYFYSPYPWFSSQVLQMFAASPRLAIQEIASHFLESTKSLFVLNQGVVIVVATRYMVVSLLVATVLWLLRHRKSIEDSREPLFHLFNLGSVLLFVLLFYDVLDTRDFRMYLSPLLLSGLIFLFMNRLNFVYFFVIFHLALLLPFIQYYADYRNPNFTYDPAALAEVHEKINPVLQFDANGNRWCNTISISKYGRFNPLAYPLISVKSGFGITTILDWKEFREHPIKARYVWLDPEYSVAGFGYPVRQFDLVELTSTSLGSLFLNPSADCSD